VESNKRKKRSRVKKRHLLVILYDESLPGDSSQKVSVEKYDESLQDARLRRASAMVLAESKTDS
jgi:hypothetical protein